MGGPPEDAGTAAAREAAITALREAVVVLGQESGRDLNVEICLGFLLCQRGRQRHDAGDWEEAVSVLGDAIAAMRAGADANLGLAAATIAAELPALAGRRQEPSPVVLDASGVCAQDQPAEPDEGRRRRGHADESCACPPAPDRDLLRQRFLDVESRDDIEQAIGQVKAVLGGMTARAAETDQLRLGLVDLYFCRAASMNEDVPDIDELVAAGLDALGRIPAPSPEHARSLRSPASRWRARPAVRYPPQPPGQRDRHVHPVA